MTVKSCYQKNYQFLRRRTHDLPVDIIVTPTRVINVRNKLKKPSNGILWDMITENYLKNIPILSQLKGD